MNNANKRVRINPDILKIARESREMSQTDLARTLGVPQGKISKIEADLLTVSRADLFAIAKVLDYPEHFFLWADSAHSVASHEMFHRRRQKVSARTLARIHAEMNIAQMRLKRLLDSAVIERDGFERIDPDEFDGDVEALARAVRVAWHIPPGPIRDVTKEIENAGGVIVRHDFRTRQVDAVSQWLPHLPPVFFVNDQLPADRERLTLGHEVGHVIMHRTIEPDAETQAARFAGEFLMPAEDIRHELRDATLERLANLKSYWKVSMAALNVRAHELGAITERQYRRNAMRLSQLGYRLVEPVDLPREEPKILGELIALHVEELGFDDQDLGYLLADNHLNRQRRRANLSVLI
ncbi:MAG: ImmA/IrrE family metallo-endopeptidase [Chloroflexi bacterium]|nr:ImmA/IrrE family metallo-endopeptidase [Chloroflexota bacterium]